MWRARHGIEIARTDSNARVLALAYLIDEDELVRAYRRLCNNAAVEVDAVAKDDASGGMGGGVGLLILDCVFWARYESVDAESPAKQ